jgi:uncharacterized protein YndB with AHSA1/START domain
MEKEFTIERFFNAPAKRVWDAWTKADELKEWWGPNGVTNPICEVDLRVGGALYIVMLAGPELGPLAGERWPMMGIFNELKEPTTIVFSNNAIAEDSTLLLEGETRVTLTANGDKTKMMLVTRAVGLVPQAAQMLAGMEAGWTQSIGKLEKYLSR